MLPCSLQEGDHRWINSVARALQLLNSLYGPFGRAYGIGRCAKVGAAAGLTLPRPEVPAVCPTAALSRSREQLCHRHWRAFPLQMCYELWRDLEEESEGDSQGRNPEIGNIFFMDRGGGCIRLQPGLAGGALGTAHTGQEAAGQRPDLLADTDYVTALCSQMVYEGLVDDTFRIKCGRSQGSSGVTWGRAVVVIQSVTPLLLILLCRQRGFWARSHLL